MPPFRPISPSSLVFGGETCSKTCNINESLMLTLRPPIASPHLSIACVFNLRCLLINNGRSFWRVTNTASDSFFEDLAYEHAPPKKRRKRIEGHIICGWELNFAHMATSALEYEWNTNLICRVSGISSFVPDYNLWLCFKKVNMAQK